MAPESIVYGCIKDGFKAHGDNKWRLHNRRVISRLPAADEWTYLTRDMFSAPPMGVADSFQTGVMHFGASYKAIEYEWSQWMVQFEALLTKLYWVSAIVHLETELHGNHTFTWCSGDASHRPGDSVQFSRREWSRESLLL